ncbi:TorF family putative porin [Dyella sp. 2RAB6]|uniref:TorF family putative porin n=1 Tax=Dyella sp. 2RAB6 TaxID=3232992 RepID=UPI003F91C879
MNHLSSLALALLLAGVATHACAEDTAAPDTTGWRTTFNAGAQSDYVFRGISQTNERPSGFAGVDVAYDSQFYLGAWTSNVDFSPSGDTRTSQEVDLYGGWRPTLAGINFDLGYIYYGYRNQPRGLRESYAETYLRASHAFGPVTLGVAAYHSPNFPGISRRATYGEANIGYTFNATWSASAAWGRQATAHATVHDDGSASRFAYNTWNLGLTWAINNHTSLDLRYWDTSAHGSGDIYGSRMVAGLKATF